MPQSPKRVESIVLACCCLHNLMRIIYPTSQNTMMDQEEPKTHEVQPGNWRQGGNLEDIPGLPRNFATQNAKKKRLYLVDYVNSTAGSVSWQYDKI
jgi:hypothetical protein